MNPTEDDLIDAIKVYITRTKADCLVIKEKKFSPQVVKYFIDCPDFSIKSLDLKDKKFSPRLIESILQFIPDSEVSELNLEGVDLSKGINRLCELLKRTKVKKLNLGKRSGSNSDRVALLNLLRDSEIEDLGEFFFNFDQNEIIDSSELVRELLQSRLTKLSVCSNCCHKSVPWLFAEGLPSTSLISLSIMILRNPSSILPPIFSKLPFCQIKALDLSANQMNNTLLKKLSDNLALSKLEKLNLQLNHITDTGLDILGQGLVHSNVTDLNLNWNRISGANSFGHCLKNTKLRVLGLSNNYIKHQNMFAFPDFLKGSSVETLHIQACSLTDELGMKLFKSLKSTKVSKLNLAYNLLGVQSISEFATVLKDTNLEDVDFTGIQLPIETFDILSGCLKESNLKSIRLKGPKKPAEISCLRFLEHTKNSSLHLIGIENSHFSFDHAEIFAEALTNSTLTHFNISGSQLIGIFPIFAVHLRFTSITHLNLSYLKIQDEDVLILAAHLKETKIMELNLGFNAITSRGARALAKCIPQTSLISLNLERNSIGKDGLENLANSLAGSFVTTLNVFDNGEKHNCRLEGLLLIDKILWENQVHSHILVAYFKRVFPKNNNGNFNFHQCIHDRNVTDFLEECLQFHKRVVEQPAVMSVLLQEESLSFSREQLVFLLFDEYPRQLVEFIGRWVEADVSEFVKFLERAEKFGLLKVVEHLLLLRPLFTIDETAGVLHPYFYSLLFKYKQPICNVAIEPQGIEKIIDYFKEHSALEGSVDVIKLLTATKMT